ncbi:FAD-dependent monooxygenase [Rhizobacter sp. LjRoot28]|uniref:FAD-dependent monooxygenase n=1 Tax=Rhizobacter sp. LjRoot28 TaxID=3342309 RepID=UPI003ECE6A97
MKRFDVCVRGAGIVGRALALSLARSGLRVALVADPASPAREDIRAYALNAGAVSLLRDLKVWDGLPPHAATAVHEMHVEGDTSGVLEFSAWEQHVSELAWITDAAQLEQALASAVRYAPHVTVVDAPVDAALTAVCEGKFSAGRSDLGVVFERHDYGHRAIAARLTASVPHRHVARQWFRSPDVLALLPFDTPSAGNSYALVWSVPTARADELLALDAAAFEAELHEATRGDAGVLSVAGERAAWPLMIARAQAWSGPGWVLLGDAAHVVHPLAGQGLNLGLADVVALTRVLAEREAWRPLGDARLLRRYERARHLPTRAMGQLTDGLLHLFAGQQPPLRELRNRGMGLVNRLPPLKRWLTARALDF